MLIYLWKTCVYVLEKHCGYAGQHGGATISTVASQRGGPRCPKCWMDGYAFMLEDAKSLLSYLLAYLENRLTLQSICPMLEVLSVCPQPDTASLQNDSS